MLARKSVKNGKSRQEGEGTFQRMRASQKRYKASRNRRGFAPDYCLKESSMIIIKTEKLQTRTKQEKQSYTSTSHHPIRKSLHASVIIFQYQKPILITLVI